MNFVADMQLLGCHFDQITKITGAEDSVDHSGLKICSLCLVLHNKFRIEKGSWLGESVDLTLIGHPSPSRARLRIRGNK